MDKIRMPEPIDHLQGLRTLGIVRQGHFVLSSGLHTATYCQCAKLFESPAAAQPFIDSLAIRIEATLTPRTMPTVIVSPAIGGLLAGYDLARTLGCRFLFTERDRVNGNAMVLRRGFEVDPDDRVLVMEDVITTGKTTLEVVDLLEREGHEVVAVACIVDRTEGQVDFGRPFIGLSQISIPTYPADALPPELAAVPVTKPGSR
jgi:orotate phosphoribosyltransferase